MTEALSRHAPQSHPFVPDDDTPVLVHRELRPGIDPATISRFGDNRWHLSPAVHEDHYRSFSLNFELVPAAFRRIAKVYVWMELNHDQDRVSVRRSGVTGRGAVYTLHYRMPHLRSLLYWLTEQEISSLADVTNKDLDRYLEAVRDSESNLSKQAALLNAVRRLWVFRDLLPPDGRLPEAPPWKGKDNRILLGRTRYDLENRTRRIPEPTMSALLCWSLRFVEDFSDDILAALGEYRPLVGVTERRLVLAGRNEVGTIGTDLLTEEVAGPRILLLGGRSWQVAHVDWERRRCFVEAVDGGGQAKWPGWSGGLSYDITRGMRDVVLGRLPAGVEFTERATRTLQALRDSYSENADPERLIVRLQDGAAGRWWTWAGTAANRTLQASLPKLVDPRQRIDEKSVRLLPGVSVAEFGDAVAAVEWRDPLVDANAVRGLKFSAALPLELAVATLGSRIGDQAAAEAVFSEQRVIVR